MLKLRLEEAIVHSIKLDFRDCPAATFNQRLAATLIDVMFYSTFLVIFQQVFGACLSLVPDPTTLLHNFFTEMLGYAEGFLVVFYFLIPQFFSGQTLGKKILKIRIVSTDYRPEVALPVLALRLILVFFFSIPPLAILFWLSLRGSEGQAWHDKFTGTRVIDYRF